jgi:hypothetical protein
MTAAYLPAKRMDASQARFLSNLHHRPSPLN